MARYTCPTIWHLPAPFVGPEYVVGCGAEFTASRDSEGWVDCPECGMGFNPTTLR